MSDSDATLKKFRSDVNQWMRDNVPVDPGFLLPLSFLEVGTEQQLDFLREWQNKVWRAGFLGMHWPSEYGGQGADPDARQGGIGQYYHYHYYFAIPFKRVQIVFPTFSIERVLGFRESSRT